MWYQYNSFIESAKYVVTEMENVDEKFDIRANLEIRQARRKISEERCDTEEQKNQNNKWLDRDRDYTEINLTRKKIVINTYLCKWPWGTLHFHFFALSVFQMSPISFYFRHSPTFLQPCSFSDSEYVLSFFVRKGFSWPPISDLSIHSPLFCLYIFFSFTSLSQVQNCSSLCCI